MTPHAACPILSFYYKFITHVAHCYVCQPGGACSLRATESLRLGSHSVAFAVTMLKCVVGGLVHLCACVCSTVVRWSTVVRSTPIGGDRCAARVCFGLAIVSVACVSAHDDHARGLCVRSEFTGPKHVRNGAEDSVHYIDRPHSATCHFVTFCRAPLERCCLLVLICFRSNVCALCVRVGAVVSIHGWWASPALRINTPSAELVIVMGDPRTMLSLCARASAP